ncbi:MAG: amidohydrolase family protein [Actinomycetes bacterium]
MSLDFALFDADHHYYEPEDAFTRHLPAGFAKRTMQWATIDGRERLLVAGRINRFIPNPHFDPVARPGSLDAYFRGKRAGDDIREAFGALEPINPGYRDRTARVAMLDAQGIDSCFMFPTLGVGMEEALVADVEAAHVAFHAFNEWLLDDWGFDRDGRILAAPYLTLLDPVRALAEVDWIIERGARVVVMRAGPVMDPQGARSPGDPAHDPIWARLAAAGVVVAYHSGESGYYRYLTDWGEHLSLEAFRNPPFPVVTVGDRPIYDTVAALICHGVLTRHPALRVATIESGSDWVPSLRRKLAKSYAQTPSAYGDDPVEQLQRSVWVSPYYEDDLHAVRDAIGVERIIFGSDYPHAEGLEVPASFVDDLTGFSDAEIRRVMRENGRELIGLAG